MKKTGDGDGDVGFPYRITEEAGCIRILGELPGVSEESIRMDLEGRILVISAAAKEQSYRMAIALPWAARLGKKRFRDGVLDLFLEKAG